MGDFYNTRVFNTSTTKSIVFGSKRSQELCVKVVTIREAELLGVTLDGQVTLTKML
jgi:hypothetical protein